CGLRPHLLVPHLRCPYCLSADYKQGLFPYDGHESASSVCQHCSGAPVPYEHVLSLPHASYSTSAPAAYSKNLTTSGLAEEAVLCAESAAAGVSSYPSCDPRMAMREDCRSPPLCVSE